jgi:hypothetical protein
LLENIDEDLFKAFWSCSIATAFLNVGSLSAADDQGHHSQAPHVHGVAELLVTYEKSRLNIVFESPSDNIVGFEHRVKSDDEKKLVESARAHLESPEKLFMIKSLDCTPIEAKVDFSSLIKERDEKHHHDKHETAHSEIVANYSFKCSLRKKIDSLKVNIFEYFPSIEGIDVQWITEEKQGAKKLDKRHSTLEFK